MRRISLLSLPLSLALIAGFSPTQTATTAAPDPEGVSTVSTLPAAASIPTLSLRRHKSRWTDRVRMWHPGQQGPAKGGGGSGGGPIAPGGGSGGGPTAPGGGTGGGSGMTRPEVGVQFHGMWSSYTDAQRAQVLDELVDMGATWIRLDVSWAMIQPEPGKIDVDSWGVDFVDRVIDMAHRRGLKILGTFWLTPDWARPAAGERSVPADLNDYGRAFAWTANHWSGKVQAWEVWNEPNSTDFLVNADPAVYTRMLCSAYNALQNLAGAPGAQVVYGGTMHNDVDWIEQTYRAGAKPCFDIMATHPYQSPADTGPLAGRGTEPWEFASLRSVREVMRRHQDFRAVWITEFGWSSHANRGNEAAWERGVTEQQQATYTVAALRALKDKFPFVRKAFIYNARSKVGQGAHQGGYGILTADARPKPVYDALKAYLR